MSVTVSEGPFRSHPAAEPAMGIQTYWPPDVLGFNDREVPSPGTQLGNRWNGEFHRSFTVYLAVTAGAGGATIQLSVDMLALDDATVLQTAPITAGAPIGQSAVEFGVGGAFLTGRVFRAHRFRAVWSGGGEPGAPWPRLTLVMYGRTL